MKTAFPALIKSIAVKSLVSGDKEGEIRLRFLPTDEVMDALQRLHRADDNVTVAIVSNEEYQENGKEVSTGKSRKTEGSSL